MVSYGDSLLLLAVFLCFTLTKEVWAAAITTPTSTNATSSNSSSSVDIPNNACINNTACENDFGTGSECLHGQCTNPFERGCLAHMLPGWNKVRVCNSDDPKEAAERGICRIPDFDYLEIRMASQNWEAVFFEVWILQIILSELLDVPTTIETGTPDAKLNLYDPTSPFDYGTANDWSSLRNANELGDCRLANRSRDNYQPCAYLIPEVWYSREEDLKTLMEQNVIEPPEQLGALGQNSWFVPKFVAERDPNLMSYLGLQGQPNRALLADYFLRPTTWIDYCEQVSIHNCSQNDGVAKRFPNDEAEGNRFFVQDLYTGHFRKTQENNCDEFPNNCTGHIGGYPCDWTSYLQQQTYWLDIALQSNGPEPGSGGYEFQQLVDMWAAANATKSNLIMQWWLPEFRVQQYLGTDSEFSKVALPPTTQQCIDARISTKDQCSNSSTLREGDSAGACDETAEPIQKVVAKIFYSMSVDPTVPAGLLNPAYDVMKLFTVTNEQQGDFFDYWIQKGSPREAICQWVVDNFNQIQEFVPRTFPRSLDRVTDVGPLLYTSTILGGLAAVQVLWAGFLVFKYRTRRVLVTAQLEFLYMLLAGAFVTSVGAIVTAISPTNITCIVAIWLVNIGYTLELVPLIVKVAAINRLMNAARRMKRVVVNRSYLVGVVVLITALVVIFLVLWTVIDPPQRSAEYDLTATMVGNNETVVMLTYYCSSNSDIWQFISVGWNALLLLCASVLAFQTRKLRQDFNESQTLAMMTYSHFVFVILRVITYSLSSDLSQSTLSIFQSFIYSADTIATIFIYFVPKFLTVYEGNYLGFIQPAYSQPSSTGTGRGAGTGGESGFESDNSGFMSRESFALSRESFVFQARGSVIFQTPRDSFAFPGGRDSFAFPSGNDSLAFPSRNKQSPNLSSSFRSGEGSSDQMGISGMEQPLNRDSKLGFSLQTSEEKPVDTEENDESSVDDSGLTRPCIMLRKCRHCGEVESEPLKIVNANQLELRQLEGQEMT